MADDKECALPIKQESLQRFARIDVEVVRRLVEQEQVGGHQTKNCEFEPTTLTTREHRNLLPHRITAEEELCEVRPRFGDLNGDSGAQRLEHRCPVQPCGTHLRQIPRHHATSNLHVSIKHRE